MCVFVLEVQHEVDKEPHKLHRAEGAKRGGGWEEEKTIQSDITAWRLFSGCVRAAALRYHTAAPERVLQPTQSIGWVGFVVLGASLCTI